MSATGFGASSKIVNFGAAGFTTDESSQVLLVSVHNVIYPITEYELHQVFDPCGYVEKIDILQSSELLQAIVQFDSCQNAVMAKSQLQGRYIYDRCCQLDIQFYKSFDNDNQTRKNLMENEFASDLDFIKNEVRQMIVIIDRMQDRIKTMNTSIQNFAHTVYKSSKSTSSISVISPTKPKVCNDSLAVVSTTSEIHMKKDSVNIFENEQKSGRNLGFPEHVLEQLDSKTYLDLLLSYDNYIHNCKIKPMLKRIDLESAHILFDGMRELSVVPQPSHIVDVQVCGVLLSENHPFNFYKEEIKDVFHRTSMDGSSKYACKMLDNMCKHGVNVGYMKRDKSNSVLKIHWEVIKVFDPGGVYMASYNHGVYYLVASVKGNYVCVYTGTNALNEWDQHQKFFGLYGQNIHFLDMQNENFPFVYYPSGYDYAQCRDLNSKLVAKEPYKNSNKVKKFKGKNSSDQLSYLYAQDGDSEFPGRGGSVWSRGDGITGRSPNSAIGIKLKMANRNMDQINHFYFLALAEDDQRIPISDENFTDELQLQEVLTSSSILPSTTNIATSSTTAITKDQCSSSLPSTFTTIKPHYDLEDKVDFEGMVMIRITICSHQEYIQLSARLKD